MPRKARVVAVGVPHHVTQRGANRQDIFLLDEDRRFYLETLAALCRRYRLTLLGYCLMTNHVHLVAVPQRPDSLAQALGNAHQLRAQRFNRRYGRSGMTSAALKREKIVNEIPGYCAGHPSGILFPHLRRGY